MSIGLFFSSCDQEFETRTLISLVPAFIINELIHSIIIVHGSKEQTFFFPRNEEIHHYMNTTTTLTLTTFRTFYSPIRP